MELAEAYREQNDSYNIGDEVIYLEQKAIIRNITVRTKHWKKFFCLYFPEWDMYHTVKDVDFFNNLGDG